MAQVRGAALALALGMGITAAARADANADHLPAGSETCWRPEVTVGGSFGTFKPSSPNIAVDPGTGLEVYVPTGETVDQVLPVVATRIPQPAVASVGGGESTTPGEASEEWCWESIAYQGFLPGGALLALGGWLLLRRRRGSGATGASTRITGLVL